ncbi:hypothetical protein BOTBODRAFT_189574 [Botryobasidium botryosum FD-172 SS1]|uniref:AAA+ ATPase domain-containing protein n=1 Tax=Botryobasidium botryosum (strain FD-172 SS1) TaxID=930990 RepID=A0A067MB49_BOTB1|nr:hypothetical protein BOTBODRAFT_189574 [Botryobasidium botryosum FD-172 SS1]
MTTNTRLARLSKHFDTIIQGRLALTPKNSPLFLEAICAQEDPASCVNKLIASKAGLTSLQAAMRFDLSVAFFNGPATALLQYLRAPDLQSIGGGNFLNEILLKIVEPPIFWTSFIRAFQAGGLQEDAQLCFAWLLLQLVSVSGDTAGSYREVAQNPVILDSLLDSPHFEMRTIAQKIKHIVDTRSASTADDADGPGGRHDNDFVDFREISILPTADEITSTEPPFLRPSAALDDPKTADTRLAMYLDNQFRLLREDMLYEMREELLIALGKKKGKHRGVVLDGFTVLDVHCGPDDRRCKWGVTFACHQDLWQLKKINLEDRKKYLIENRKIIKHQSQACLLVDGEVVAFPTINRDESLLAQKPPVIVLQFEGEASVVKSLLKFKTGKQIKLIQIDTAVFSFEPVLKALQDKTTIPLSSEILFWTESSDTGKLSGSSQPMGIVQAVRKNPGQDLQRLLGTTKSIILDKSQSASLLSGLTQKVSLIQGPPGTGKSFIGALLAKAIHDSTKQTILVVCYTNHALDQFLEDLLDIGIPEQSMIRLGGKSTPRTAGMTLQAQSRGGFARGKADWRVIDALKSKAELLCSSLQAAFKRYIASNVSDQALMEHLEFDAPAYFYAFEVPRSADNMTVVGKKGQAMSPYYLLNQWVGGRDAGHFKRYHHVLEASEIWRTPPPLRRTQLAKWKHDILKEQAAEIYDLAKRYNECRDQLDRKFSENTGAILGSKRIVGCTTTAAAKYTEDIRAASPEVLLVEEAGEILETHVLTAMGSEMKQLILIGDHKQLRPKVNNYQLTVEKGEGYDLNRSLFERLVLKGYPHETLTQQHRMRPEISALIRHLTYPDLVDAAGTKNRPNARGIRGNIVFINHEYPEDEAPQLADRRDMNSTSSKQNTFEVQMILKIVRYLAQQGYRSDQIVILTPYLGQLHKLTAALSANNDPILNDMDSFELVRAGLMPAAAAKMSKKPIRLATIDNYQGEESDIVLVTLVRSNSPRDIGFMSSPERLNVLLSRARDSLVMIGNAETFLNARKGKELWVQLFEMLRRDGYIHDGLPVKCERHPTRIALLRRPEDFDEECPDGGCKEPCGTMLNCGLHVCPSKCHQLADHSKMPCEYAMASKCPKGHIQNWRCHKKAPVACTKCDRDTKLAEQKRQRDFDLQEKRDAEQLAHAKRLAELDEKIASERQAIRDAQLAKERNAAVQQKEKDLQDAIDMAAQASTTSRASETPSPPQTTNAAPDVKSSPPQQATKAGVPARSEPKAPIGSTTRRPAKISQPAPKSPSQLEWERMKTVDGESNDAIDAIMELVGLEEVKVQVLRVKSRIDVTKRQNTSLKHERFNTLLLGNPGTGKTTVARQYAKFLTSLQVLPGSAFIETTGSRLANDGVSGIKKHIEEVINAGGGAIFVDEAYQLTGEHNFQGRQVLDFLLAEMENRVGSIVFILAGYKKQMEKFMEHNPGLTSRLPYTLYFEDYTDEELLSMLEQLLQKRYQGRMQVEDGVRGLYGRIAVRRLARGRGREGFGNARALQNMFSKICDRQAERVAKERREGLSPGDFLFTNEDIIGPDPSKAITKSAAWEKLQTLTGLGAVKQSVSNQIDLITVNYKRELQEIEPIQMSLNRVFLGSPGTGKTTVAKLYGQILTDLGLLSNGEVVLKNPADFIGSVLGQSESNTKAILANTVGKVLVIDEAYMLYGGTGGAGKQNVPYKVAVIDTIVAEVQSVPGEDRCVLLLGYKDQIVEMFQNVNPGLSRRFAIEDGFHFEDFTDSELLEILNLKLKNQDLEATDDAKRVAIEVLSRSRNRPNFGNGGEVENLLGKAKNHYQSRYKSVPVANRPASLVFEPQDFDPDFDRNMHASANLEKLFEDVVGCEDIVRKLGNHQKVAQAMKIRGIDARNEIPMAYVFKGPPGTGKTTTARKMGHVYYDMGFLSSPEVVECSASDLIGEYVGQTGPKTKGVFEKALGRVLFVDEAYRLSEGRFAKEAIDELVGAMTQERYKAKIVIILAGYDQEMNELMAVNPGLSSRFPDEVVFRNMRPAHCLEVLDKELKKKGIHSPELSDPSSADYAEMSRLIEDLCGLPAWGNARDIMNLAKQMVNLVFTKLASESEPSSAPTLARGDAIACVKAMLADRRERYANVPRGIRSGSSSEPLQQPRDAPPSTPPSIRTAQVIKTPVPAHDKEQAPSGPSDGRDDGVSDEIWHQLQADKKAAEDASKALQLLEQERLKAANLERAKRAKARLLAARLAEEVEAAKRKELERRQEEARAQAARAKAALDLLEARRKEEERKRQKEAKDQAALRRMGVCCAGFQWIKQATGYRCAGGSHFVGNEALG